MASAPRCAAAICCCICAAVATSLAAMPAQGQDAGAPDAASPSSVAVPPVLVHAPSFPYPEWGDGQPIALDLLVTVGRDGNVVAVEEAPTHAGDPRAVEEVLPLARDATFEPAMVNGIPVLARVGWHVVISAPAAEPPAPPIPPPTETEPSPSAEEGSEPAPTPLAPTSEREGGGDSEAHFGARAAALRPPPSRGTSDVFATVSGLRDVPRTNAAAILATAAPGLLITNEGGEGHADGYVLRGFVADEGTGLELLVDGVPINEPGNPHAEGLADTHFVIPELVRAVRVLEGPFDPHQGNYAVAGTAEYVLGLDHPGLSVSLGSGTYGTERFLSLYRPEGAEAGTFGGVELRTTAGFGDNRAAKRATAMAGYELRLSSTLTVRALATAYATTYQTAGYLRADDLQAGRVTFFGTYDPTQGGDSSRESLSVTIEDRTPLRTLRQLVFLARRDERVLDDTTGFAGDMRGDATDQRYGATTVGARGSARYAVPGAARVAALELGYHARFDATDASQQRFYFGTFTPYASDLDAGSSLGNLSFYADAELRPLPYVTLRGGGRLDYFAWDVATRCPAGSAGTCAAGHRSADGLFPEPRGTLAVGPFEGLTFAASAGIGVRTADPASLAAAAGVTVASVSALDAGVVFERLLGDFHLDARVLYYFTYVSHDALFDPDAGRVVATSSTTRQGFTAAARLRGPLFDAAASVTYADAHFGSDGDPAQFADASRRAPYVPPWVGHVEAGIAHELFGWRIGDRAVRGRAAFGVTAVSDRPLPGGESSAAYATLDASLGLRVGGVELGVSGANLFDARYRLVELPYASNFVSPTALTSDPVRHFVAGAPLMVMVTLTMHLDRAAWEP